MVTVTLTYSAPDDCIWTISGCQGLLLNCAVSIHLSAQRRGDPLPSVIFFRNLGVVSCRLGSRIEQQTNYAKKNRTNKDPSMEYLLTFGWIGDV